MYKKLIKGILFIICLLSISKITYASNAEGRDLFNYSFVIYGGWNEPERAYVIKDNGNLWSVSLENWNRIKSGDITLSQAKAKLVFKNVKAIVDNHYALHILTDNGDLYGFGTNEYGAVGNGTTKKVTKPVKILSNIVKVSNLMALDKKGNLYSWGTNSEGRLGTGLKQNELSPKKVLTDVKKFEDNGGGQVLAIKTNGELWGWGSNRYGRVGNGSGSSIFSPVKILDNIRDVFTFSRASMAITNDNVLYVWGSSFNSTFAYSGDFIMKPKKYLENVKYVYNTQFDLFIVNTDNELLRMETYYEDSYEPQQYKDMLIYDQKYQKYRPVKLMDNVKTVYGNYAITDSNELYYVDDTAKPRKLANKIKYIIPQDLWTNYFISESNNLYYIYYYVSIYDPEVFEKVKLVNKIKTD